MLPALITDRQPQLEALCRRHHVVRLELFGSAATGEWDPDHSDLDFLVKLDKSASLLDQVKLQDDLQALFGRKIDLVSDIDFKNPYFRRSVENSRTHLWGEARPSTAVNGVSVTDHRALKHLWAIREECEYLQEVAEQWTLDDVLADQTRIRAVPQALIRIGEELNALSRREPEIARRITDYRGYIGQRHIIVHRYYDIDWDRIWHAVTVEAPLLMQEVEALMNELKPKSLEC